MSKLKENIGNIIMCIGEILLGIILLLKPVGFTKSIIIGIGIILIISGVVNVIKYFTTNVVDAIKEQSLSSGLTYLIFGIFCAFHSNWFISTFPVLAIIYGIIILLTGLKKVEWTFNLIRLKRKHWFIAAINAILSIIFALIIIRNPFTTTTVLWQFTGIALIIEAILDLLSVIFDFRKEK